MKKMLTVFLLIFLNISVFAIEKTSKTLDNFAFRLYQVDKDSNTYRYEYYVELKSNETEEYFVWSFTGLSSAMVKFKELENIKVVEEKKESNTATALGLMILFGRISIEEAKNLDMSKFDDWEIVQKDKRDEWRKKSFDAEVGEEDYIRYFIDNE